MILADNETKVDLLNNEAIAVTIIKLLRDQQARPVTIGVHGDWGAGKSSILEMVEAGLGAVDGVLCLKFNGWRFQGFEDAKIVLIESIVTSLIEKRPALAKAGDAAKDVLRKIDWLKVAKHAGGLAVTAFTGIPTPDQIQAILEKLQGIAADPAKLATKDNLNAAVEGVKSLIKADGAGKSVPKEIEEFRKAFDGLLSAAKVTQLVVLIDDLDRCLPDTAIETLEAVRLFVFTDRTAFIVAADEAMIEYAVRKHFPELPDTTGPRDYARNYLEKLIQVPFRIPPLGEAETRIYVTLLLAGAELGEGDPAFARLIAAARERLKRPWANAGIDAAIFNETLGDKAARAQAALTLSDRIGPILAAGVKGNPRQIKRFLNTLLLRHRAAEARGFGEEVKLPVLAKLMLAERFQPRLYDQIASASAAHTDGLCEDLAVLEAASRDKGGAAPPKATARRKAANDETAGAGDEGGKRGDNPVLQEWLASQAIGAWAAVEPGLAKTDLRPYLFVSKDRKDYFGAASALGTLSVVAERLMGPRFSVQALEGDLRQLAQPEAARLFEALRGRVMASDAFDAEPPGVAGLTVLVRAQPSLQNGLLDLLEALPRDRCGPWVVRGWDAAITERNAADRFAKLLEAWTGSGNAALKAAAAGVMKARAGKAR